ncbi:MAG: hypothetical protein ACYS14_09870 [Planctomycetota bacterium]
MDWKKVERVRRSIKRGDYVHPLFLISTIETGFDHFSDQLLSEINGAADVARDRAVRGRCRACRTERVA